MYKKHSFMRTSGLLKISIKETQKVQKQFPVANKRNAISFIRLRFEREKNILLTQESQLTLASFFNVPKFGQH